MQAFDAEAFVRKCFSEHVHSRVNDDDAGELAERVECLVAELSAAMGGRGDEGWRPIETAPKDGTKVILLCVSKSMSFGGTHAIQGYWGGNTGFENWITLSSYKLRPTHWMPLPAAPGERSGE
jgi:hypothetical protein